MKLKHKVVNHLFALAAFGNTIATMWVIKEAHERGITTPATVLGLVALYVLCYCMVAMLRSHRSNSEFDTLFHWRSLDKCGENTCHPDSEFCGCKRWAQERAYHE